MCGGGGDIVTGERLKQISSYHKLLKSYHRNKIQTLIKKIGNNADTTSHNHATKKTRGPSNFGRHRLRAIRYKTRTFHNVFCKTVQLWK